MTEAADAKPEDIEFLRTRLRELKIQAREDLEVLRRDRDQMRQYKTVRDDHNKEVRSLIESVKAEREERDRINKEISEAKDRRAAIHAQLKSVYDEIRELRSNIVGSPSTDQRRMMRRVEELEWRQQTEQLSMDEERSIVEEIAKIEAKLVKIGQEKEKQDRIHEQRRLARRLKEEASEAHQKVLKLSEQSQIHHQEVVRIRPQLEEFKRSADTAHQNFVEWLKKVKEGENKLKDVRTEIDDIFGKIRKHDAERRDTAEDERRETKRVHTQERVDAAVEKMQSGKRLTFDEFILAQRSVTDDKRGPRRRGGRRRLRKEEEVAAPDKQATTDEKSESPKEEQKDDLEQIEEEVSVSPTLPEEEPPSAESEPESEEATEETPEEATDTEVEAEPEKKK
ncbi:MAG: coiled-coil protein [Candidatus Thorarchaeota archaeon]